MLKQVKKNWFHLLIWSLMLIFLAIAPILYARFLVKNGKPVQFSQELPPTTDQIKYSIDRLDSTTFNGQDLFNLWGWAFFLEDTDQAAYERYIVLRSDKNKYFFPTESFERPDLQLAFTDLNMDIRNTGISTYISEDTIRPGKYQIGILFRHRSSGANYYIDLNKVLIRTPNTLSLEVVQSSELNTTSPGTSDGQSIDLDQQLPTMTDQIRYSVDRLDPITSNGQPLFNLWGWAFLLGDPDQSKYERYIVLQSETKTLSFLVKSFQRPNLQKAFPDINIDLLNAGLSINLSTDDISEGIYNIGILFKNPSTNAQYFIITNKQITRSDDQIQLVKVDAQP